MSSPVATEAPLSALNWLVHISGNALWLASTLAMLHFSDVQATPPTEIWHFP